jgi:methylaspartate ammonia-lyase
MLAKPGMGVDEGMMIVSNEMNRALALDRQLSSPRSGTPLCG